MSNVPKWVENREQRRTTFFDTARESYNEQLEYALASLVAYREDNPHWVITYSGGKDSSALVSFVLRSIETGKVKAPETLKVLYADTHQELPPLAITARQLLKEVEKRGYQTEIVEPDIENRYWVKILGYGYPPPRNGMRWCTRILKKEPMDAALAQSTESGALVLTGVRKGESAARDGRIAVSCSTKDGECGQGWYQQQKNALAPLLTWRVCHVWRYLYSDENILPVTQDIQAVYAVDDLMDIRTGCVGCGLLNEDYALKYLVRKDEWSWLAPYMGISTLTEWLRQPAQRHRKVTPSLNTDGKYRNRYNAPLGALTMDARKEGLDRFITMQNEVKKCHRMAMDMTLLLMR